MTPTELAALQAKAKHGDLYALGAIPSKIDLRDKGIPKAGAGALPATFTHPAVKKVPVRSQQGNTCVGNSIATAMEMLEYVETGQVLGFSGELMNARVVARQYGQGAAAVPRDILQDVYDHGAALVRGSDVSLYFPAAYAAVDFHSPDAVKAAMSTPGTVLTACMWLISNFGGPQGRPDPGGHTMPTGTDFVPDIPGEQPWAYHEITFVGYEDRGILYQNSWDSWWGDHGFGRMGWDHLAARCGELWAVTNSVDTTGGLVLAWAAPDEPAAGRAVRKGTSAAVYLVEQGGRIWVQSLAMAKQMGVDMSKVASLPPTDAVWNTPVIGLDAPLRYQG
jgi:hypothetical protein